MGWLQKRELPVRGYQVVHGHEQVRYLFDFNASKVNNVNQC
jgi:hypothetical protein